LSNVPRAARKAVARFFPFVLYFRRGDGLIQPYDIRAEDRFGIFVGPAPLVFLKPERGGTIDGPAGAYRRLAAQICGRCGCAAAVSANPADAACDLQAEIETVTEAAGPFGEIVFVGVSEGALAGAQQGWQIPALRRMLLINAPLMAGWHETRRGIERFRGEQAHFLCGTGDPSWQYFGILQHIHSPVCRYSYIAGADHRFTGMERRLADAVVDWIRDV